MRRDYQAFQEQDAQIIVVGPHGAGAFEDYWSQHDLPFIGIPDPDQALSNLFNQEFNLIKLGRMPVMIIIDKNGEVRYRHDGHSMRDIPANAEVLALFEDLNQGSSSGLGTPNRAIGS